MNHGHLEGLFLFPLLAAFGSICSVILVAKSPRNVWRWIVMLAAIGMAIDCIVMLNSAMHGVT